MLIISRKDLSNKCLFRRQTLRLWRICNKRKKEGEYNPFFLKELLQSTRVRKEITSWSGGSTRYNIGQDSLNKITIIIPTIKEQNKISNIICSLNKKITLLKNKYEVYYDFKKYLMQQIFTQTLRIVCTS